MSTATHHAPTDVWMSEREQSFASAYPAYARTGIIDELRATEYGYLDQQGHVYLDYTGSGLASNRQLRAHAERVSMKCFGNPHSESPASNASTELVEHTRSVVLDYFNASPDEYVAIFTANATGACRLIGEAYPFGPGSRFVMTFDNHNSVNGIREYARARGTEYEYVPLTPGELRVDPRDVQESLSRPARRPRGFGFGRASARSSGNRRGLFAFPAQSNFSGVQHPLELVGLAQEQGYDVLLDAAAFVPTNRLDLSAVKPDFVPVSWYKVFGHPTGLGCLLARREALSRLRRPWFSGGTIQAVSVHGDWHALAKGEAAYEDGTLNFLSIPGIADGISWMNQIGLDNVHDRVVSLTGWLLDQLTKLRHSNGRPLVRIYGPRNLQGRGATVAFNFLNPNGGVVDERAVARDTTARNISVRTGCFCNPGVAEEALAISPQLLAGGVGEIPRTIDEYVRMLGLPTAGGVRVSLGLASNLSDVEQFLLFATSTYRDLHPDKAGLPPRLAC